MSVYYSEIIWFGGVVAVLVVAALVGLWKRENPDSFEPVEPLLLSPAERMLFRREKLLAMQKAAQAKKAARQVTKAKRQELAKSRQQAADAMGPGGVKPQ